LHSATIAQPTCCEKFRTFLGRGNQLDRERIYGYSATRLMLVTALSPVIGYQELAPIAENGGGPTAPTLLEAAHLPRARFGRTN